MTDGRTRLPGDERAAPADERPGAEPDDRDPAAENTRMRDWMRGCEWDCACLGDRGSRSEGAGQAARGEAEPKAGFLADGSVEDTAVREE